MRACSIVHCFILVACALCATAASAQSVSAQEEATRTLRPRASIALSFDWMRSPERTAIAGGAVLTIPVDGIAARKAKSPRPASIEKAAPPGKAPANAQTAPIGTVAPSTAAPGRPSVSAERELAELLRVRGDDVRAAVEAAIRHSNAARDEAKLERLAARARWSSALPELRLRAMRQVNETASATPTSYDPFRQTSSGGISVWLEARATWSLDRALFSEAEIRIARIERDVAEHRARLERRVLDLLFGWQAAVAERLDPSSSFRECRHAVLHEQQLATELDFVTHGWFWRWLRSRPSLPEPDCLAPLEPARAAVARPSADAHH
jgi:hypothetical protein